MSHNYISDANIESLDSSLKGMKSRPDKRRRQTMQVIERLRVSEMTMRFIVERFGVTPEIVEQYKVEATLTLRAMKKIK